MLSAWRKQKRSGRKPPHYIIVKSPKGEKAIALNPAVALAAGSVLLVFSVGYFAATGYLLMRDDMLAKTALQEAELRRSYEDEITKLRGHIETLNSKQQMAQHRASLRLESLESIRNHQSTLEQRQQKLLEVLALAQDTGLQIASFTTNPKPLPKPSLAQRQVISVAENGLPDSVGGETVPLENPGHLLGLRPTSTTIPAPGSKTSPPETNPKGLGDLSALEWEIRGQIDQGKAVLASVFAFAQRDLEALKSVADTLEVDVPTAEKVAIGGPYEPLPLSDFNTYVIKTEQALSLRHRLLTDLQALPLAAPLGQAPITSDFGARMDPFLNKPAMHTGVDFKALRGTPIKAPGSGKVTFAGYRGGYGKSVEITHDNGLTTRFAHMHKLHVKKGDRISTGDVLGEVGNTGRSTGPHLHYETRVNDTPRDPMRFIRAGRKLTAILGRS
ncbi:M23 family metallopeptidase [Pseudovibrio exalbescens]|uniref:M23 family metallopeptidase n=1 Tax=Pseudovibrio exalbescens TaxID=197461 RepID=UPI000C9B7300|nr:M23 family metallopeptidase [Pseudovibrio exalbescens]